MLSSLRPSLLSRSVFVCKVAVFHSYLHCIIHILFNNFNDSSKTLLTGWTIARITVLILGDKVQ